MFKDVSLSEVYSIKFSLDLYQEYAQKIQGY